MAKTANDATASAATKAVCEEAAPARQAHQHDKYSVDAKLGNSGLGMSFGSGDVMGRHLRITKLPLTMAQYKSIYGSGGALLAVGHQLVAFNDEDIPINLTNREKLNMIKFKMDKAREPGESNEVRLTFLPYGPSEDVAKQNGKVEDGRDAVGYMLSNPAQKPATPTNRRKRSNKDESISVIDKSPKRIPGPPIPSKNDITSRIANAPSDDAAIDLCIQANNSPCAKGIATTNKASTDGDAIAPTGNLQPEGESNINQTYQSELFSDSEDDLDFAKWREERERSDNDEDTSWPRKSRDIMPVHELQTRKDGLSEEDAPRLLEVFRVVKRLDACAKPYSPRKYKPVLSECYGEGGPFEGKTPPTLNTFANVMKNGVKYWCCDSAAKNFNYPPYSDLIEFCKDNFSARNQPKASIDMVASGSAIADDGALKDDCVITSEMLQIAAVEAERNTGASDTFA